MKVSEVIDANGIMLTPGTWNVGFGDGDETQFDLFEDTSRQKRRYLRTLEGLFRDFCKENGIKEDAVDYIEPAKMTHKAIYYPLREKLYHKLWTHKGDAFTRTGQPVTVIHEVNIFKRKKGDFKVEFKDGAICYAFRSELFCC